jgi:cupin 2 domain-containing protein
MKNLLDNLYNFENDIPQNSELFHTLLQLPNIHIELIESCLIENGQLYFQDHDEWIVLLEGNAILELKDQKVALKKGDFLLIHKNTPHRVLQTNKRARWLAIHIY